MNSINRLVIYEKRYYNEINRRDEINRRVSLPLGLIVLLFGTIPSYFLPALTKNIASWKNRFLMLFILIMIIALIKATIYLVKTYLWVNIRERKKYEYAIIPLPDEIENYLKGVDRQEEEFHDLMLDSYLAAIKKNYHQNNIKEYYLYKGVEWIIYTLCILGAAVILLNCRLILLFF